MALNFKCLQLWVWQVNVIIGLPRHVHTLLCDLKLNFKKTRTTTICITEKNRSVRERPDVYGIWASKMLFIRTDLQHKLLKLKESEKK